MNEKQHTLLITYHFLRELSVRVSRNRISQLLDTPVGNSMRGISDTLDALYVKNEVYQLPSPNFFYEIETPFITMIRRDNHPFCVVTQRTANEVNFIDENGKKRHIPASQFLQFWTEQYY